MNAPTTLRFLEAGSLPGPARTPIDPLRFRHVLGHYPTGVCVVTAIDRAGEPAAMVVGTFTSVSLDPPLVGFLPDRRSTSWARIAQADGFCVNVLGGDQGALCRRLAARDAAKFSGLPYRLSPGGAPILPDVTAWIDCGFYAVHPAGDHDFALGEVTDLALERVRTPLLFFQGGYGSFAGVGPAAP